MGDAAPADPWTIVQLNSAFNGIAFGGGTFVAVGEDGVVVTSTDGTTWTRQVESLGSDGGGFAGVAYDGSRFVAVGDNGGVSSSTDGTTWSYVSRADRTGTCALTSFTDVTHDGSQFVATGFTGLCSSTDGLSWTSVFTLPSGNFEAVGYASGIGYVATLGANFTFYKGATLGSMSLVDLNALGFTQPMLDVAGGTVGGTNMLIAVGSVQLYDGSNSGSVVTTTDNSSFTVQTSSPAETLRSVAIGNNMAVAVGTNGDIYTSADGAAWTVQTSAAANTLQAVAYNGTDTWAAAGVYDTLVTGDNAATSWTSRRAGSGPAEIQGIDHNGSLYVLSANPPENSLGCVTWTSPDATTWTDVTSGTCAAGPVVWNPTLSRWGVFDDFDQRLAVSTDGTATAFTDGPVRPDTGRAVHELNGQVAMVQAYGIEDLFVHGTDPTSLVTLEPMGTTLMEDMAYGGGYYVAVGQGGAIYTSPDGSTWTAATSGTGNALQSVVFNGSRFVAVGDTDTVVYTAGTDPTGTNWTLITNATGLVSTPGLADVIWDGTQFVAVGAGQVITTSADGTSWAVATPTSVVSTPMLTAIAFDGTDTYVAVGEDCTRWTLTVTSGALTDPGNRSAWVDNSHTTSTTGQWYYDIAWSSAQSRFVTVGSDRASASADGTSWSDIISPGAISNLVSVADTSAGVFALRGDGYLYTIPSSGTPTVAQYGGGQLKLKVLNGEFVVYGDDSNALGVSSDGVTWEYRSVPIPPVGGVTDPMSASDGIADIAYGGGVYVITAFQNGQVYRSTNGVDWSAVTGVTIGGGIVTYGAGTFVAGAFGNEMDYSADGLTWSSSTADTTSGVSLTDVLYDGTQFIGITYPRVYVSSDGTSWKTYDPVVPYSLKYGVPGTAGLFATGAHGLIVSHGASFP